MHATEHRCGILISGPGLSSQITGTDPLKDNLPLINCEAEDAEDKNSVFTANLTNAVSEKIT